MDAGWVSFRNAVSGDSHCKQKQRTTVVMIQGFTVYDERKYERGTHAMTQVVTYVYAMITTEVYSIKL